MVCFSYVGYLPAKKEKEGENPWISEAQSDLERKKRPSKASGARKKETYGLKPSRYVGMVFRYPSCPPRWARTPSPYSMLAKKYRLPIQLFPHTRLRTLRNQYFIAKVTPNSLAYSRFGVLVSKKVAKNATERNKLRRQVFRFVRANAFGAQKTPFRDILIILSPASAALPLGSFKDSLKEILLQL